MTTKRVDARPLSSPEPPAASPAVLIAGPAYREPIIAILAQEHLSVDVFDDVRAVFATSFSLAPGLILLQVDDASLGLADCIKPLTQHFAQTPVVMVSTEIDRWAVRAALKAGVTGVVLSTELTSTLAPCIHAVLSGQACVPRKHWQQVEPPALSSREKQILGLVVMGYMNGQIADQLFLAESTVKSHLSSAFGKLGVRSRNEAVSLILDPERGLGTGILSLSTEPSPAALSSRRSKRASPPSIPATGEDRHSYQL